MGTVTKMATSEIGCVLECGRERWFKDTGLCRTCHARLRAQKSRGIRWAVKRARQISSWASGLDWVQDDRAKLIKPPKKRRKRA